MERILNRLDRSSLDLQLILACGKNESLMQRLRAQPTRLKKHVEGFTSEIPYFMRLADFFIGKPGPGSISEAIHMGLPVITVRNLATLPQERYNADWLSENSVGLVVSSFGQIVEATGKLLAGGRLATFSANAKALRNRALFEIPPFLDTILRTRP
jgi:1,2-diacylglycerol 3-beta-galactosyltransferase